ncbi:iron-containing redox enzyme family protein [Crenothrix sp.]|uniref:iron-containing redox enzyme family protein n=1 Tax=Crenothrix sp. TaxID=3100433 RepID=UPI00374DF8A5
MKAHSHPFDPGLQPVFSGLASTSLDKLPDSRELFFGLIHSSEHPEILPQAYCYLKQQFWEVEQLYGEQLSRVYQPDCLAQLNVKSTQTPLKNHEDLSHYAPVILTEFYSLSAVSQAATSLSPLAVDIMAVYLKLTGSDSYVPLFKGLLQLCGLNLPALHSRAFIQQADIDDSLFNFAVLQLAFILHCRTFFAEMLGFTLACCQTALFSEDDVSEPVHQFIASRQRLLSAQIPAITAIIEDYIGLFPEHTATLWYRVQSGFYLYQQQVQCCQLAQHYDSLSPQQAIVQLLQRIAPKAVGHHGNIKLADKGLDEWFAQDPFKGEEFQAALKQSAYINKTMPERSVLLKLFDFGGPMFGVLNQAEKQLLRAWILEGAVTLSSQWDKPEKIPFALPHYDCKVTADVTQYSQLNHRQLYYYLINADVFPGVLSKARQHVHNVLWRAQCLNRLPFKHYSHPVFADYIQGIYQAEVDNYQPLKAAPRLSKQAYIWGIEQFAPAILTDGCWLQHCKQLSFCANSTIGDILFKIYEDETGNGILEQNHPFIYQQLLDSVGINLAPLHSQAFSEYSGFIDSAFDIPVYLMAISKFPSAFLPELLGLNMAIEISGLGKVYLRLAQELKFYGINPAIVNVHISIDNVATGHTALAVKAIQHYMDDILARQGKQAMQNHWRRIYTGYCSLQSVGTVFKYALIVKYWLKKDKAPN